MSEEKNVQNQKKNTSLIINHYDERHRISFALIPWSNITSIQANQFVMLRKVSFGQIQGMLFDQLFNRKKSLWLNKAMHQQLSKSFRNPLLLMI
ncbi:CLUMA_CG010514, isoform A [Clunio marinus]|uniref:CLUMA_CG010514, isoform A n=1 Tax=Clunio marinus TaxID=568069 RepID=A0A1J1IA06_9DIPT|nr:CLUMA_CG010514, isoform A [Clunio marinus]